MIGRKLSHFRILDRLGEGGMGVVYRAEDEKLQRTVALKVLPPDKLGDEGRRLRFLREARSAAAVTHPNIAVVYAIDEADGVVFIAMELIEGKTLREVIGWKPMPLREALRLGVEMAEGLSAAHQAKVIHRDLKPDNVIVTSGGHAKILDFGLAKLLDERCRSEGAVADQSDEQGDQTEGTADRRRARWQVAADLAEASKLATVSDEMTQAGRVLGTAAYMSPEQARGLAVDARSDLFSFGIVLYEMVTGKAPFRGTTSMDTLTAILREQAVPAVQLNPEVPAELERILEKCLEKEPGERYQDGRDLIVDLRKVKRETESQPLRKAEVTSPTAAVVTPRRAVWKRLAWTVAPIVVIGALAVVGWAARNRGRGTSEKPEPVLRQITGQPVENPVWISSISRDGGYLIHGDAAGVLYVTKLDGGASEPLRLPEGLEVKAAEWSSDGTTVFLLARASGDAPYAVWSYSLLGGTPRKIFDFELGPYLPSPDGKWFLLASPEGRELRTLPAQGGTPRQIASADQGERFLPVAWSPDSRRFADVRMKQDLSEAVLETRDLNGGNVRRVLSDPRLISGFGTSCVAWLPGGRLVFALREPDPNARDMNLREIRIDPATSNPVGVSRRLSQWSNVKVYELSASADGRRLAVLRGQAQVDVYIGDLDQDGSVLRNPRRFTTDERADIDPSWTPDGTAVLFQAQRGGHGEFHRQAVGSSVSQVVLTGQEQTSIARVSPDGKSVLFMSTDDRNVGSIARASLSGGPSQRVNVSGSPNYFDCPSVPTAPCVLSREGGGAYSFSTFDPTTGQGHDFATLPIGTPWLPWALSPDGTKIAIADADHEITLISVPDGRRSTLQIENILRFSFMGRSSPVSWTRSSDALYIAAWTRELKRALLRVDLSGRSRKLIESNLFLSSPVASPDGKHLAWVATSTGSNVWLLENF